MIIYIFLFTLVVSALLNLFPGSQVQICFLHSISLVDFLKFKLDSEESQK